MAQRKKQLIAEGKLDKHGRPNADTPKEYLRALPDVGPAPAVADGDAAAANGQAEAVCAVYMLCMSICSGERKFRLYKLLSHRHLVHAPESIQVLTANSCVLHRAASHEERNTDVPAFPLNCM